MTIKPGDTVDLEGMLTADDGSTVAVKGPVEVVAIGTGPLPPDPGPLPPDPSGLTEKTYSPEAFNDDFEAMQAAILADQKAAGDNKSRAVVQFQKGKRYEYMGNDWLTGVQNYRCEAVGSGVNPVLFCSNVNATWHIDRGPLNIGKGANCFAEIRGEGMAKTRNMALIATVAAGATTVTLKTASEASRLKPGRWHAVFSYAQQVAGYPPNCRWIDYVKVASISGSTVTLDRPLVWAHSADYWENPGDEQSVGKARIGCWDGFDSSDTRATLSGHWKDITFEGSGTAGIGDTTYIESHINCLLEDCSISDFWPSMNKYVECRGCTFTGMGHSAMEADKLSDVMVLDNCTTGKGKYLTGGTGFNEIIIKNSHLCSIMIGPRKLTVMDSTLDAMEDAPPASYNAPFSTPMQGNKIEYTFTGTTFVSSSPHWPSWSWNSAPVLALPLSAASWQGNKLIIPKNWADGFESWLCWLYEGIMLFTGPRVFDPVSYGRVDKIHAPADGSALWADVTWIKGNKPTSGNLNIPQKGLRKLVWGAGTTGIWTDADFISQEGTPGDRAFPQGIS